LKKHHVILDYYKNKNTCLDEEGKQGKVQGIPRAIVVRETLVIHLKKSFKNGLQFFSSYMEETIRDEVEII
jgi:hypothetical protein